jgi:hypothetical protein
VFQQHLLKEEKCPLVMHTLADLNQSGPHAWGSVHGR